MLRPDPTTSIIHLRVPACRDPMSHDRTVSPQKDAHHSGPHAFMGEYSPHRFGYSPACRCHHSRYYARPLSHHCIHTHGFGAPPVTK